MIKKRIEYIDFDGKKQVEEAYFHISKLELMDNEDLREQITSLRERIADNPDGEPTDNDVKAMLDLVKRLFKIGYGKRSEDGKRFYKNDDIWEDFEASPAYEEAIFSIFSNAEAANEFMAGIIPTDLLKQAEEVSRNQPQDHLPKSEKKPSVEAVTDVDEKEIEIARLKAELESREQN